MHSVAKSLWALLETRKKDIHPVKGVSKYSHSIQTGMGCVDFEGRYLDSLDLNAEDSLNLNAEWVVAGLFHDVMGGIAPYNHGECIAKVLEPFITSENALWVLAHHEEYMRRFWYKGDVSFLRYSAHKYHVDALRFTEIDWASFAGDANLWGWKEFKPYLDEVFQ